MCIAREGGEREEKRGGMEVEGVGGEKGIRTSCTCDAGFLTLFFRHFEVLFRLCTKFSCYSARSFFSTSSLFLCLPLAARQMHRHLRDT